MLGVMAAVSGLITAILSICIVVCRVVSVDFLEYRISETAALLLLALVLFCIIYFAVIVLWCISCCVVSIFSDKSTPCTKHSPLFRFYANCIIDVIKVLLRIKVHISGEEKLPCEKFLLVGNHCSAFDPIIEMGAFSRYNIGFIAKKELFDIPVIGKIMHKCFCLPVGRENSREDIKAINMAAGIIKSGEGSVGIYPEGKRDNGELLPFKAGAFKAAKKAECPVVIVSIKNSELIKLNTPFKRTNVYIDIIDVLDRNFICSRNTSEICDIAKTMIENHLKKVQV